MSETTLPINVAQTHAVVANTSSEGPALRAVAAGALNITHKRPAPGSLSADALAAGLGPTPAHNLVFRGGRTIKNLTFQNLYVGGSAAWAASDIQNIDSAMAAAMTDARLNTVINQYFGDQAVGATAAPSRVLPGPKPTKVTRSTVSSLVKKHVVSSGLISQFDPTTTIFNFLLPAGTILTTGGSSKESTDEPGSSQAPVTTVTTIRSGSTITTVTVETRAVDDGASHDGDGGDDKSGEGGPLGGDPDDKASSLAGLGGYHGSVHVGSVVVYFAVGVYSAVRADGTENGIVAFDQPWKNVVATFYHELQEARTDPDVEDAIRTNNINFIGWNSAQGEEIGDFPVFEANPLQEVFKEVPLLQGGVVPVQLMYSNRVNGPENPTEP